MGLKEDFINKAHNIHGDKYDYSLVDYINNRTKVKIICKIHGVFEQTPGKHTQRKQGCPRCSKTFKRTNEEIINDFKLVHGDKYDYSLVDSTIFDKIIKIICPIHGIFEQNGKDHKQGHNCPKCANKFLDFDLLLEKAKKIHNNKYDYSLTKHEGHNINSKIICPIHGVFEQYFDSHLKGIGCPYCSESKHTTETFIDKANKVHNNKYDYSLSEYINSKTKVKIICPIHGIFEQVPTNHLIGSGCLKCKGSKITKAKTMSKDKFIEMARLAHGDKYDYSEVVYLNCKLKVIIICPIHGIFEQVPDSHVRGNGCPKCGLFDHRMENEVADFIESIGVEIIRSDRTILEPKELDIYVPSHKLAFEFDGLHWHSDTFAEDNAILYKTNNCEAKGIRLIHIFEDEWTFRKNVVKSRIKNILGLTENKIFARKCIIKEITSKEGRIFLDENHLQGYTNSTVKVGLFYNEELVSVMTFNTPRKGIGNTKEGYELSRFASKLDVNILGGADKLLQYFIRTYNPSQIITYADRRWSNGGLYEKLGFSLIITNKPNYWYIFGKTRKHRLLYRKQLLIKEGFDGTLTEREIMKQRGIERIYDCGTKTYLLKLK